MNKIEEILTTTTGTEGSLLVEKTIYDTLKDSADKKLLPRTLAAIVVGAGSFRGSTIDIDLATPDSSKVYEIGEGAAVPIDDVAYTNINLKPRKFGVSLKITKEMQEDGKWDLIEYGIKTAGREMAENETSLILAELQSCTNNVSGGAAITIANITRAMQYLEDDDYEPTDLLVGPEVVNDLRNIDTFVEADKLGSRDMLEKGMVGKLYGMNVWVFSANAAPSTTYSKYAYVIDRDNAFAIGERRPLTVTNYDDATHDMSGAVVTCRIDVELLRDEATARISTS